MSTIHRAPRPLPRGLAGLLAEARASLDDVAAKGQGRAPWTGTLRRLMTARTVRASTAVEGFVASHDDTVRLLEGHGAVAAPRATEDAIRDYRRAMDRVASLAAAAEFQWTPGVVHELQFLATASDERSSPGRWREIDVHVRRGGGGIPYEPPPASQVASLMRAAVEYQANSGDDPLVRAALMHLHVAAVHPFVDGNGRTSRVMHSLALARAQLLPLDVCSIESRIAGDTAAYYGALRTTNGTHRLGGPEFYDPERSVESWIEYCITAHRESARDLLAEMDLAQRRAAFCLDLVRKRDLPERLAPLIDQALVDLPVTNESHRYRQNVSMPTATNDLRRLVDLGWFRRKGRGRSTEYTASARLRDMARRVIGRPPG